MNSDTFVFIAQTLVLPATLVVNLVVTVIIAVTAQLQRGQTAGLIARVRGLPATA